MDPLTHAVMGAGSPVPRRQESAPVARRLAAVVIALACLAGMTPPAFARPGQSGLGLGEALLPASPHWSLEESGSHGRRLFAIPDELAEIERLPAERRNRLKALIRERELDVEFVRRAIYATRGAVRGGRLHAKPEYMARLQEIVIGIDRDLGRSDRPLWQHEPILLALPAYTRINIVAPAAYAEQLRREVSRLGLRGRAQILATPVPPEAPAATRWIRDTVLVSDRGKGQALFHPLSYWPRRDLVADDLRYLNGLRQPRRSIVTVPLFYRAGNFLLGVSARRTLFVGTQEIADNEVVYRNTLRHTPRADTVLAVFSALTGADQVTLMPNTRRFYHIDMYMTLLDDGVAAVLDPFDPEALPEEDREALQQARSLLLKHGYRIVDIPTLAERIAGFQSSTNIVPFRHRDTGERKALVPVYPDRLVRSAGQEVSLNALVEQAYRRAGVTPIAVEDRFYTSEGNTHCVVLQLR
jgi:hypothetical protein